jgi:hypothetical protein
MPMKSEVELKGPADASFLQVEVAANGVIVRTPRYPGRDDVCIRIGDVAVFTDAAKFGEWFARWFEKHLTPPPATKAAVK